VKGSEGQKSSELLVLIVCALHDCTVASTCPEWAEIPSWHHWERICQWFSARKPEGWERPDKETGARGHVHWSLPWNIFIQICGEPPLYIVFWAVVVTQCCSLTILALRGCGGHQRKTSLLGESMAMLIKDVRRYQIDNHCWLVWKLIWRTSVILNYRGLFTSLNLRREIAALLDSHVFGCLDRLGGGDNSINQVLHTKTERRIIKKAGKLELSYK